MKIYFAGSVRGGREDAKLYLQIIQYLLKYGDVLTEHLGDSRLKSRGETNLSEREIHSRDLGWVREADVIVAEVTVPSLGVGYEIGRAVDMGKRILCLYRKSPEKRLSAMIAGGPDVVVKNYKTLEEAKRLVDKFFSVQGAGFEPA